MSEEEYSIQYLGFTPYLVYRLSGDEDFIVIELDEKQQDQVDNFQTKQYVEAEQFARDMLLSIKQAKDNEGS